MANEEGTRYIIGDAFGRTALLSLDNLPTDGLVLLPLGEVRSIRLTSKTTLIYQQVSPATTMSYITNQVLFLGSHYGDSQLLRINPDALVSTAAISPPLYGLSTVQPSSIGTSFSSAKGKGKVTGDASGKTKGKIIQPQGVYLDVLETRANIAPIMDAVLADTDGSGLVRFRLRIVSCSAFYAFISPRYSPHQGERIQAPFASSETAPISQRQRILTVRATSRRCSLCGRPATTSAYF
jgi:DNA damage-binding protein 1